MAPPDAKNPIQVLPMDAHNQKLVECTHPPDHQNPKPEGPYRMVVIGAGPAGLITALIASSLGAKTALIEKHLMGGDCLQVGCVPSKALLRAARAVAQVKRAGAFGVKVPDGVEVDFPAIMERVRRLRAEIAPEDSVERYREEFGIDVYLGEGRFLGPDSIQVGGETLEFDKACIATGARPFVPPIPGIEGVSVRTNESIFELTELPARLAVLGGGPIGCELSQAFARFGSQVSLLDQAPRVLPREEDEASQLVQDALLEDQVELCLGVQVKAVSQQDDGIHIELDQGGEARTLVVDEFLVAAGRRPNTDLDLEKAEVDLAKDGKVQVDDFLGTSNPRIFAAGDVASAYQFTHTADAQAKLVITNAFFSSLPFAAKRQSSLNIPWVTYTEPEVAHVGWDQEAAQARGFSTQEFRVPFHEVHRSLLEGETEGYLKVWVEAGTDRILGATMVGPQAGELINEVTLAMDAGMGLGKISDVIHPYPVRAEILKKVASAYKKTTFTPFAKRMAKFFVG